MITPVRAADDPPPAPGPALPAERIGAVETYHEPEAADDLGIGWTRLLFYWSELKKDGPGTWNDFHVPMTWLDREISAGREVVGVLQHTPAFATDGSVGAGVPRGLYLPVDDPGNLWAGFCREVMTRYDGRVTRWVIWNEPDIPPDEFGTLWEGTPADYYQLVRVASLVADEVNPDIRIHLAGLTYWFNPLFLTEFLDAASEDPTAAANDYYFDVATAHVYFKPESTIQIVGSMRAALAAHGLEDKPIWLNETNAPPYDDILQPWPDAVFPVTSTMQADFIVQEFALAFGLNLERAAVYKLVEEPLREREPYGLLRNDRSETPAYHAFDAVTRHYAGVGEGLYLRGPALMQVLLERGEQTTRVYWARRGAGLVIEVPALAESALLVEPTGAETRIYPRVGAYTLALDPAPCEDISDDCLMGGGPLMLVEEAPVDLAAWASISAEMVASQMDGTPAGGEPAATPNPWPVLPGWLLPGVLGLLFVAGGVFSMRAGRAS